MSHIIGRGRYARSTYARRGGLEGLGLPVTQAAWFINAVTGSDANNGATSGTAIASWAELARRWGDDPVLSQDTDVFIETDLAEELFIRGKIALTGVSVLNIFGGVTATLHSGSITAKTDLDPASQQPSEITDAAVGDWDTAGPGGTSLIGQRIRLTSGANIGAVAWLAKRVSATEARTSPFGTIVVGAIASIIDPAVTDDYDVEQLVTVEAVNLSVDRADDSATGSNLAARLHDLAIVSADRESYTNQGSMAIAALRSRVGANRIVGGQSTFSLCALSAQLVNGATRCFVISSLWDDANDDHVSVTDGSRLVLNGNCLLQTTKLQVFANTAFDSNGVGIFDTDGTAMVVFAGGFASFTGLVWGDNNTLVGIQCEGTGRVAYRQASKPIVTGTAGDTIVGDDGTQAYAAIPLFNVSDGSAIVESDGP